VPRERRVAAGILARQARQHSRTSWYEFLLKVPVRSLTAEFDPDKYTYDYRVQVLDLIGRKAAGEEFELPAVADEKPKIVDMMAALEASVEAAKAARQRHPTARAKPAAGSAKKAAPRPKTAKPGAKKTA
jgi:DNA end-binding protein Ku